MFIFVWLHIIKSVLFANKILLFEHPSNIIVNFVHEIGASNELWSKQMLSGECLQWKSLDKSYHECIYYVCVCIQKNEFLQIWVNNIWPWLHRSTVCSIKRKKIAWFLSHYKTTPPKSFPWEILQNFEIDILRTTTQFTPNSNGTLYIVKYCLCVRGSIFM